MLSSRVACALLVLLACVAIMAPIVVDARPPIDEFDAADADARVATAMSAWRSARESDALLLESQQLRALSWHAGQNNYTLERPEGLRDYFVYVPKSYSPDKPTSLVLTLHGLGDTALHFSTRTNLTAESEVWGFILIYPQGSTSPLGTSWNAGTCCADQSVDDVTFLSTVISLVTATFAIRKESIHSMGFSNGGFMTERLGCTLSTVFTSIGSISGGVIIEPGNADGIKACDALYKSPTHILHIHGNLDFIVPWDGDELLGFPSVPDNMAGWTGRNQCLGQPVQTLNQQTFTNQVWSGCNYGNTSVELVKNEGGGHVYITSSDPTQFDFTRHLLDFWNRVTPGGL